MKLVVFDMDGTLADSGATIVSRVTRAFMAVGMPEPPEADIRANVGLSLPLFAARVSGSEDPQVIEGLIKAYRAIGEAEKEAPMPLFAGIPELLERLHGRADMLLGVATGKSRRGLDRLLAKNDIGRYFATLQTPDTNASKPHPDMLFAAMAECGTEALETLMVGDAVFDIDMARAAGVRSIAVGWGMQELDSLKRAGATAAVTTVAELDAAITRLLD